MDISVIISTRNRAKHLPQMLDSLKLLDAATLSWEIVFVDNGSSDATGDILNRFCDTYDGAARVIHEPKPGLSAARNTGWKASTGSIVCFTDDDCYPKEDWLLAIRQAFDNPKVDYLGGRVLLFDPTDAPITIQTFDKTIEFPKHS